MRNWRGARSWAALVVCLAVPCWSASAQASPEAAKRYFQNGVDLITAAQPNYQDAYYQFQLAYRESAKSWKVLGNLGLCALKLERDQEAVSYYEQYLEKGRSEIALEERNAIEQDLLLLRGNLATIRVSSAVQDLKIVDQRAGSSAPGQPYTLQGGTLELKLRAGNHSITASSGNRRLVWEIVLEPQSLAAHEFDFDAPVSAPTSPTAAAPVQPASSAAAPAKTERRGGSGLRTGSYVALGVGALGLGLGGYFSWRGSDASSRAENAFQCNTLPAGCAPAQKTEVRRIEAEADSARTRAAIAFSVGGAAAVTGIVLLVLAPSGSEDAKQSAGVVPWVGFGSAGLAGRF